LQRTEGQVPARLPSQHGSPSISTAQKNCGKRLKPVEHRPMIALQGGAPSPIIRLHRLNHEAKTSLRSARPGIYSGAVSKPADPDANSICKEGAISLTVHGRAAEKALRAWKVVSKFEAARFRRFMK
jgi:hypothetical protein